MTTERLRQALTNRPFRPFSIHLADGAAFDVRHPEMALHTEGGRTIFLNTGGEDVQVIDLLLVTRLSFSDNRKSRRRTEQPDN